MAKLKSGTRIYGTATIDTSVVVGSAVTANSSGIQVAGIVTATSFSGSLSGYATSAGIATNLNGGLVGNIPYQSAANTTTFLANGSSGTILQSNGVGNAPTWVSAAPAGAITGITIRDEGTTVGTAAAVSSLNFVGINIVATASGAGATITIADNLVGTGLSISGISTFSGITTHTASLFGTTASFTGIATASQLVSTVATGTAPLTVTSTTQVNNLNVQYLGGQLGSYYTTAGNLSGTIPSAVLGNSTVYVGTTAIALNRASAAQSLTGITSIDGSSASVANAVTFNNGGSGAASGTTFNGSTAQTISYNTLGASPLAGSSSLVTTGTVTSGTWSGSFGAVSGANLTSLTAGNLSGTIPSAVLGNSTHYVGTTAITLNRASAAQSLTGITSIDGSSASVANAITFNNGGSGAVSGTTFNGSAVQTISYNTLGASPLAGSSSLVTTGTVTSGTWSGSFGAVSGANLTSLTAGNLSGTIPSAVLGNSTVYVGTTAIALNRASATQSLTGINIDGSSGSCTGNAATATNAGIATNIKGGLAGNIHYQSAPDTTTFLANGTNGYVLQSNGVGNAPTWAPAAPSGAVSGITIRDSTNTVVGTSGSVTQLTFSSGLSVTGATGAAGIATITLSSNIVGTSLSISGISTFANGPVLIGGGTSTGTAAQPLQVTGSAYVSGNVGIGTTNPLQKLHVLGNLLVAAGSSTGQHITQKAYELNSGTLSWEGSAGQLFSITNNLTSGSIFSVNDVSGIPSIDVNADGTVSLGAYGGNIGVGTTNPTSKLQVAGNILVSGIATASQLVSTVATGTAPLTVTSTTLVSNLNSQYLNGQLGSYYTTAGNLSGTIPSAVLGNSTVYVGTTAIVLNRASASQSLTGITSIDGYAASVANAVTFNNGGSGAASGTTFNGSAVQTISYNTVGASPLAGSSSLVTTGTVTSGTWSGSFGAVSGANLTSLTAGNLSGTIPSAVLGNSTHYVGTTAIALNRASAAQSLTGITSIDGSSASVANAITFNNGGSGAASGTTFNGSAVQTISYNTVGASPLAGSSSLVTTGTVTSGTWSGSFGAVSGANLTSLNASNLSSGTVPSARITASSGDFTVGQNLFVTGSLSVGGTSITLNAAQLQIKDRDIVLGITTDANGNDVSTDLTATHGGISIASTQGNPLINLPIEAGINSLPSTYKQLMWVRQNGYSGMGTDAWVSNYAVSIGNTSTVQNGSRLTVGAGFTVYDTYLDALDIRNRNLNVSGVSTFSGITTHTASLFGTNASFTGVATASQLVSTVATGTAPLTVTSTTKVTNLNADLFDDVDSVTYSASHRANRIITGGGTITVDASYNILWSTRFIVISNGYGSNFSTNGYFDITCPTSGTITGVGGASNVTATAAGIPLAAWQALYYILPIGSNSTSLAANFRVASYSSALDIPHNWVLICVRNDDITTVNFNNGIVLGASQSMSSVQQSTANTANTLVRRDGSGNFTAGTITAAGGVLAAGASGFYSTTYATNARNPIWRFGNADAYGLSYFQGSSGVGGDTIGFHFGTATAAASLLQLNNGSGAVVNGTLGVTGQFQSTQANSTTTGGGQIFLNGATGNRIDFNGNGVAAPTTTTRSVGTKIVLFPSVSAGGVDYALGIDSGTVWSSVYDSTTQFKWYAGTTNIATLFGTGELVLGTTSKTGTASQPLQVTGGAYVSGNLGVGVTNPTSTLTNFGSFATGLTGNTLSVTNDSDGIVRMGGTIIGTPTGTGRLNIQDRAGTYLSLYYSTGLVGRLNAPSSSDIALEVGGTERLRILGASGNLGIGTVIPAEKLHIHSDLAVIRLSGSAASQTPFNIRQGIVGTSNGGFSIYDVNNSATRFAINSSGNIGIGTNDPTYKLHVVGSFGATTKSFIIDHPTKEGKKLQYGSLEGPELGVYVRGRTQESIIELPEYWTGLVREETITVNITAIGNKNIWVEKIEDNKVYINSKDEIDCFYTIFGERKDVDKLEVEM